jgi:threonine dehydratase
VSKECDGVFGASDSQTTGAIRLILGDLKQMVEPSGAIATAVLLSDAFVERLVEEVHIRKIAVVLCGGNIGVDLWKSML